MAINIPANRLALLVCLLWAVLPAIRYFYVYDLTTALWAGPYLVVCVLLTSWWIILTVKALRQGFKSVWMGAGMLIAGISALFWLDFPMMERFDWAFSYDTRMQIVHEIDTGANMGQSGSNYYHGIPPVSNGGNQVFYYKNADRTGTTVLFFINRNFQDYYSAFVYTSIPEDIQSYETRVRQGERGHKKLREHWYRVTY